MAEPGKRGVLIVFEGIDGAGKTTQVQLLAKLLQDAGEDVVVSKEPTRGPWGRKIRASAVHGRMSLEEELEAFVEDRRQHVSELIQPALDRGAIVILDRYYLSTIAYQGSRGGDVDAIRERMREFPEPSLAIVLDVEPREGLRRVSRRDGTPNYFEREDALEKAREVFLSLVGETTVRIDGGTSVEDATAAVTECVLAFEGPLRGARCTTPIECEGAGRCVREPADECAWTRLRAHL